MNTVTIQNGNIEVTVKIVGKSRWEHEGMVRDYLTLETHGKREPISKLYEIIEGGSRDHKITVRGRTYGYDLGICCDSKTKRRNAAQGVEKLVSALCQ